MTKLGLPRPLLFWYSWFAVLFTLLWLTSTLSALRTRDVRYAVLSLCWALVVVLLGMRLWAVGARDE